MSSSNTFLFLLKNPEAFPGQTRCIISQVGSGSTHRSSPSWMCQRTSKRRRPGAIHTRCLSHFSWLLSTQRSSGSTIRSLQMPKLYLQGWAQPPYRGKLISATCIHSFGSYWDLMTTDKSWRVDGLVNLNKHQILVNNIKLKYQLQFNSSIQSQIKLQLKSSYVFLCLLILVTTLSSH